MDVRMIDADVAMTGADGRRVADRYRMITTLTDHRAHPAAALVRLYHERWEIESAFLALRHTLLDGRVLRSGDRPGVEQELQSPLSSCQLLRMAMVTAVETRPGTHPDRASFTSALEAARQEVTAARGICPAGPADLAGVIGRAAPDPLDSQALSVPRPGTRQGEAGRGPTVRCANGPGRAPVEGIHAEPGRSRAQRCRRHSHVRLHCLLDPDRRENRGAARSDLGPCRPARRSGRHTAGSSVDMVWRSVRAGGETKTRKSRRTPALPVRCVEALTLHRECQAEQRKAARTAWQEQGLVFASSVGTERNANNVLRSFRAIVAKAGLPAADWTPREMRHSFVSLLSDSGVPIEKIALLVGHAGGSEVTETVYRKQIRPVLLDGAEAMDHIFARLASSD
jgi:Phage integrase family